MNKCDFLRDFEGGCGVLVGEGNARNAGDAHTSTATSKDVGGLQSNAVRSSSDKNVQAGIKPYPDWGIVELSCVVVVVVCVFSDRVEDATEAKTRHDNKVATGSRRHSLDATAFVGTLAGRLGGW